MSSINIDEAKQRLEEFTKTTFAWNFKHITYEDKIRKSMDELFETNPTKVIKFWWNTWDNVLWWIYWGKIYAIWWWTWEWKSTWINQLAMNLSKQWVKLTKYSLEDRLEDIWKEELFYTVNRIRKSQKLSMYSWIKFVNNEYWYEKWTYYDPSFKDYVEKAFNYLKKLKITELEKQKQVSITDLVKLMEEEAEKWTKVFFIDHLHYFKMNWEWRTDLEIQNIMHDINEVARKYNVAVFLIAHYKKLNWTDPDNDSFKDASAIKQVANIIIHIVRDWELTSFRISKLRWPIKKTNITWTFDIETFTYNNFTLDNN